MSAPTVVADNSYVDCSRCEQYGVDSTPTEGAHHLAGLHDDIHHRGTPTATVRPTEIGDCPDA